MGMYIYFVNQMIHNFNLDYRYFVILDKCIKNKYVNR